VGSNPTPTAIAPYAFSTAAASALRKTSFKGTLLKRSLAETKGFEPLDLLRGHTLSRRAG
jgi:hypothetical protein